MLLLVELHPEGSARSLHSRLVLIEPSPNIPVTITYNLGILFSDDTLLPWELRWTEPQTHTQLWGMLSEKQNLKFTNTYSYISFSLLVTETKIQCNNFYSKFKSNNVLSCITWKVLGVQFKEISKACNLCQWIGFKPHIAISHWYYLASKPGQSQWLL